MRNLQRLVFLPALFVVRSNRAPEIPENSKNPNPAEADVSVQLESIRNTKKGLNVLSEGYMCYDLLEKDITKFGALCRYVR